jgi:hypothetical protein
MNFSAKSAGEEDEQVECIEPPDTTQRDGYRAAFEPLGT